MSPYNNVQTLSVVRQKDAVHNSMTFKAAQIPNNQTKTFVLVTTINMNSQNVNNKLMMKQRITYFTSKTTILVQN